MDLCLEFRHYLAGEAIGMIRQKGEITRTLFSHARRQGDNSSPVCQGRISSHADLKVRGRHTERWVFIVSFLLCHFHPIVSLGFFPFVLKGKKSVREVRQPVGRTNKYEKAKQNAVSEKKITPVVIGFDQLLRNRTYLQTYHCFSLLSKLFSDCYSSAKVLTNLFFVAS